MDNDDVPRDKDVERLKTLYGDDTLHSYSTTASGSIGPVFAMDGGYNQFDIGYSRVCYAKHILIRLEITNTHETDPATLINAPFLFSSIELYANGILNAISTIYPEELWFNHLSRLDHEKTKIQATLQNWNYRDPNPSDPNPCLERYTSQGVTIAAGETREIYVEVYCLLNRKRIPIDTEIINDWALGSYFTKFPLTSNSAMTDISKLFLNRRPKLYILGEKLTPEAKSDLITELKSNNGKTFRSYICMRQVLSIGSLVSGSKIDHVMTVLDGHYMSIIGFLRARHATREQRYQFDHTRATIPAMYTMEQLSIHNGESRRITICIDDVFDFDENEVVRTTNAPPNPLFAQIFRIYEFLINSRPDGAEMINWSWKSQVASTVDMNCELVIIPMRHVQIHIKVDQSIEKRFYVDIV